MPSRMFVFTRHLVEELMKLGERRAEFKTYSLLFLCAYAFLLRFLRKHYHYRLMVVTASLLYH